MAHHIRKRFPDQKFSIDQLIAKDSEFLCLCDEYDACINAIQYWTQSKEPEAEIMIDEFRNIAWELEEEVIEALITQKTRSLK
jgi:uncharacterized protein YdcH (DUF465 family)